MEEDDDDDDVFLKCGQWFVVSKVILILRCLFEMLTWKGCERKRLWAEITLPEFACRDSGKRGKYLLNLVLRSRFEPNTLRIKT